MLRRNICKYKKKIFEFLANNQKGKPSNGLPFLNIYNMTQKQKVIYLKGKVHKMKKYISIDIGGTAIKYGIICENAEIMMKETMKTEAEKGGSAILEKVFVIVEKLQGRIQEKASGICISTAGMVNTEQGAIFYSAPLIPNYTGMQFKKLLEDKFKIPCEVENDVNCAGLAEYRSGAAKGSHVALILTIGTGIGGSIIMDGEVYHGFSNSASKSGRTLQRWEHEAVLEAVHEKTWSRNETYKQRRCIVEHPFGTVKRSLGYSFFLRKRIENVDAEASSMFIAYNLKRLFAVFSTQELIAKFR